MAYVLLVVSFALLLGGALVFTNAVEWAGVWLDVGAGAVGSILAAAAAMPESLIPMIALVSGSAEPEAVAIGAIVGAPFLLGTLAMALVGAAAFGFRGRGEQDERLEPHGPTLTRDLVFLLVFFGAALVLGIVATRPVRLAAAVLFVAGYVYVWRSLARGGRRRTRLSSPRSQSIRPRGTRRGPGKSSSRPRPVSRRSRSAPTSSWKRSRTSPRASG